MTREDIKVAAAFLFVAVLIIAAFWYEALVWEQCLADHTMLYCMRVLGR